MRSAPRRVCSKGLFLRAVLRLQRHGEAREEGFDGFGDATQVAELGVAVLEYGRYGG